MSVLAGSALVVVIPRSWRTDPSRPIPDAIEYAIGARNLAHSGSYTISLLGANYPPRYPFGFPALLAPFYWLPHAPLATGVYGAITFGILAVFCVYLLARATSGSVGAFAATLATLFSPALLDWSHTVMSETATAALASATALVLYAITVAQDARRRHALVLALGALCGLAVLVHLPNFLLLIATPLALGLDSRVRNDLARTALWFVPGPLLALEAWQPPVTSSGGRTITPL